MIAHCPHCDTAFRIVADQLRVRDGKVRCGVCRQVFDGHAALERARRDAEAAGSASAPSPGAAALVAAPAASPHRDGTAFSNLPAASPPLPEAVVVPPPPPPPAPSVVPAAGLPASTGPVADPPWEDDEDDGPVLMIGREAAHPPLVVDTPRTAGGRAEPRLGEAAAGFSATGARFPESKSGFIAVEPRFHEAATGFGPAEPHFGDAEPVFSADPPAARQRIVAGSPPGRAEPGLSGWGASQPRQASDDIPTHAVAPATVAHEAASPRRMVASRPDAPLPPMLAADSRGGVMRLFWTLGFWLALLVLLAQAIWWWRQPLAAYFPPLRAPLEILCQSVGCEVGYLRAPQRLSIVSSSVQPDVLGSSENGVQRLQLQATLRNRASHAQPWPALEIVLTDHGDAMVARRVVPPSAYLPPNLQHQPFAAGAEQPVSLALTVRGTPVSGYRLNLFFP